MRASTELTQLRDLADAQHKLIATLVEEKTELLGALITSEAGLDEAECVIDADMNVDAFGRVQAIRKLTKTAIARAEGRSL